VRDAMSTMAEATRAAGAFVHEGLFYSGAEDYLAGMVPFVVGGLAAGQPVLVAVPGPNLDLIRAALGADAARVRMVDMSRAGRNPGRIIPGVLHAFIGEHAGHHPYIIGEPIWAGRSADEYPACVTHEALINEAFAGRAATILCPYDTGRLAPEVVADAAVTHPVLVERGARQASPSYAPLDLVAAYNRPLPEPSGPVDALEFGLAGLATVRRFVAAFAARAGLGPDRAADLQVAVNELATNSVSYAGGTGTVRVWRTADAVVCEVRDRGRLTDPMAGRRPAADTSDHGRGLLIVNHLCDLVRVHSDGSGTTIRLYVRY
jgi:anti-sigma regulatory factor (Ser/Thr protein kinase)